MTAFALNKILNYLHALSLSQSERQWLADRLIMPTTKSEVLPVDKDTAWLDDALSKFHSDWGGEKDPVEIAEELRQGAELVRDVESW